ncbi:MAG: ATP-binding protein, partial [Patescibacteria group bacterium]
KRETMPVMTKKHKIILEDIFISLKKYFKNKLLEKEITLVTNFPPSIETVLPSEYLEIILSNLLSNSIKYSQLKSLVSVMIKTDLKTIIEIKDQGIGMTEEEVLHMFDRFYRGKTAHKEHGHGIGLSIVKQICDIYKLPIIVRSEKEKGTVIQLTV